MQRGLPPARREEGVALIIAVLMLVLIAAVGIVAMEHSGADSQVTGRLRRSTQTFYAADGGVQIALSRLAQDPPVIDPFEVTTGDGTTIRSGPRTASGAQPILPMGQGAPPDGNCINVGSPCPRSALFQATTTAFEAGGSSVEVEAGFAVIDFGSGGY